MRPDRLLLSAALLATPVAAQDLTPLTFHLNWLPQGEHCGFFEASAGGLYEAAGLDVTILGGPTLRWARRSRR
jgi:NitT/TauT family transport system substrate-binding protein